MNLATAVYPKRSQECAPGSYLAGSVVLKEQLAKKSSLAKEHILALPQSGLPGTRVQPQTEYILLAGDDELMA